MGGEFLFSKDIILKAGETDREKEEVCVGGGDMEECFYHGELE